MPGCVLRVAGDEINIDLLLERIRHIPDDVLRRGEPRNSRRRFIAETSGVTYYVSENEDLKSQVDDALKFVGNHPDDLKLLRDYPGVEEFYFDFAITLRIGKDLGKGNIAIQCERFTPEFIAALGEYHVGIELTLFP